MRKRLDRVDLRRCHWKALMFGDGAKGAAFQLYVCVEYPRLTCSWSRSDHRDLGKNNWFVDGEPVADYDEAAVMLAMKPEISSHSTGENHV